MNRYPSFVVAVVVATLLGPAGAAPPPPRTPAGGKPAVAAAATVAPPFKDARAEALENEIVALVQRRGEQGVDPAMLELQIDLRVLARAVVGGMGNKIEPKPEFAAAYLRQAQLLSLARAIESVALTPGAGGADDGLRAIGAMTYRPVDASSVGSLDAVCAEVAKHLGRVAPAAGVPMRPPQVIAPAEAPRPAGAGDPLADLTAAARKSNVTPALRRQLLALADAARNAGAAADAAEARTLTAALSDAVDLAAGLQTNTAVALDSRQEIERQLGEGLALYADVRTREAGRKRLKVLQPYRNTLVRVGKIRQNPDASKLGKLFVWAQENPEDGGRALSAVEAYNRACAAYDATDAPASLPPNVKKASNAARQSFANARATFLSNADELGDGGMMSAGPQQLDEDVRAMNAALELIELVEASPKAVDVLLAYKPRPGGGLEKRVIAALLGVGGEGKVPAEEATDALRAVKRLADVAGRTAAPLAGDVPAAAAEAWAGGMVPALDLKVRSTIAAAASAVAAGEAVDPATIARLNVAADLCDALRAAAAVDEAVLKTAPMARWADWGLSPQQLDAVLKPYRDATAAAVDGVVNESNGPVDRWPKIRAKYEPLVGYVRRMGDYAGACAALPDGPAGAAARLATPLAFDRFGDVRLAGYAIGVWSAAESAADLTTADEAAAAFAKVTGR